MKPTCLFVINGLGLGNSTRCHAVMEYLADAGAEIHVLTSGNGLDYFRDKPCVKSLTATESYFYSGKAGGISGWSTMQSVRALARIAKVKRAKLEQVVNRINPELAVIDSEYTLAPLRRRGIPIVALNTSEMIVTEYLKRQHPRDPAVRSHFWFVEYPDYLFHRHCCDLVLSPFPLRTPTRQARFRRVGLIVRREVLEHALKTPIPFPSPRSLRKVVFMLSGSVHASKIPVAQRELPFKVEVVGRPGESRGNVTFHGRQMNNTALLASADALVINGGYSAVSEAFALGKPVFVVPVPGHAEQFVNARLVQDLGLGFVATEASVLDQLLEMHARDQWLGLKPRPPAFEIEGAREASAAILSLVQGQQVGVLEPALRGA